MTEVIVRLASSPYAIHRHTEIASIKRASYGGVSRGFQMASTKIALNPKHPERICWGCDKYCPANDLRCGNGTIRTQHPIELFGEDWLEWELPGNKSDSSIAAEER